MSREQRLNRRCLGGGFRLGRRPVASGEREALPSAHQTRVRRVVHEDVEGARLEPQSIARLFARQALGCRRRLVMRTHERGE